MCRGQLPFVLDKPWREIWWTVDGKTLDKLPDRFTQINRCEQSACASGRSAQALVIKSHLQINLMIRALTTAKVFAFIWVFHFK